MVGSWVFGLIDWVETGLPSTNDSQNTYIFKCHASLSGQNNENSKNRLGWQRMGSFSIL